MYVAVVGSGSNWVETQLLGSICMDPDIKKKIPYLLYPGLETFTYSVNIGVLDQRSFSMIKLGSISR